MRKTAFYFLFLIILLFFSFLVLEISIRSYLSIKHYNNPHVSYWGKTWYSYQNEILKLQQFDKYLFKVMKETNIQKINLPRWIKDTNITINHLGFRENENKEIQFKNNKKILVTGDSFVFGSQVSNDQTWPSYLEQIIKIKVFNGGQPAYSSAQSLRKAIIMSRKYDFDYFIWSFIYEDFDRDETMNFLIKKNNTIQFNEYKNIGSDLNKKKNKNLYLFLKEIFFTVYLIDREILKKISIFNQNDENKNKYKSLLDFSNNYTTSYTPREEIEFLINEFKKIEIDNKYILIQHTDFSKNTEKKIIDLRKKNYNNKYKKLIYELANINQIQIIDTEDIFKKMSEKEQRMMWFDHHSPQGNKIIAELISKNINF